MVELVGVAVVVKRSTEAEGSFFPSSHSSLHQFQETVLMQVERKKQRVQRLQDHVSSQPNSICFCFPVQSESRRQRGTKSKERERERATVKCWRQR